ncbi:sulfotransferase 1A1-like [Ptychodera flava]|uniref:sulfotransferase 1A1-like n=1 Tax=Ptychodera flava TaxID=63121 RepID=UPI00396A4E43
MDSQTGNLKNKDGHSNLVHRYKGRLMSCLSPVSTLEAIKQFDVRDDDIWIMTYPKSGTNLSNKIVRCTIESTSPNITKGTDFPGNVFEFHPQGLPKAFHQTIAEEVSPRVISTHLHGELLPEQLTEGKAKLIYIARNPKDVATSMYYHFSVDPSCPDYSSWSEFYEDFKSGQVVFDSWADHVLYWWNRRHWENVLFITYEALIKDRRSEIKRISEFLGMPLDDDQIDMIEEESSFTTMKKNEASRPLFPIWKLDPALSPFVRKGIIGDWKNRFTVAENERFNEWYAQWIGDSGLKFDYD